MIKKFFKKILPRQVWNLRHLFFAWYGAFKYKHPSEELVVIGVTGTSGKSTTTHFLRQILEEAGYTVGSLSTIDFYIAGESTLNDRKMTMLGKMEIQKYLRKMVDAGCNIAIIETTSEGRLQHRHRFINYDLIGLTNLYPEHIESHGSFEKYKQAKKDIFNYVSSRKHKVVHGNDVPKACVVNAASEYAEEFLETHFEKKCLFARNDVELFAEKKDFDKSLEFVIGRNIEVNRDGLHFDTDHTHIDAQLYGEHNIENLLAAFTIARCLNIDWKKIAKAATKVRNVPGRIEFIHEAEEKGFSVIVDYAFEPGAMEALYSVTKFLDFKKIIHVFGSTGGGRDKARRFSVGTYVGEQADICIITDEDPYDDDPMQIIDDVASAVENTGKKLDENLFKILSRKKAIQKAIDMANRDDLILITGKGSEQAMVITGGKLIPWDDREEVRSALLSKND
ncbi:MAG: UDP-N-acetylmuramyl-tripeptide synthetase [Candidatus Magasanikbacteria bacterium]